VAVTGLGLVAGLVVGIGVGIGSGLLAVCGEVHHATGGHAAQSAGLTMFVKILP
jgi:hypothetical protein